VKEHDQAQRGRKGDLLGRIFRLACGVERKKATVQHTYIMDKGLWVPLEIDLRVSRNTFLELSVTAGALL
jgi:hypothetical protein